MRSWTCIGITSALVFTCLVAGTLIDESLTELVDVRVLSITRRGVGLTIECVTRIAVGPGESDLVTPGPCNWSAVGEVLSVCFVHGRPEATSATECRQRAHRAVVATIVMDVLFIGIPATITLLILLAVVCAIMSESHPLVRGCADEEKWECVRGKRVILTSSELQDLLSSAPPPRRDDKKGWHTADIV